MKEHKKEAPPKQPLLTPLELRIIAVSLSILSLGLAIAYVGFFLFHKT